MLKRSLFLIFLVIGLMCGSASAYARYQNNSGEGMIRVLGETGGITLAEIDAALDSQDDATYGGPYPDVITVDGNGNYSINYGYIYSLSGSVVDLSGVIIHFNNTQSPIVSDLSGDYFNLTNSKVYGIYSDGSYITDYNDMNNLAMAHSILKNTEFYYISSIRDYYLDDNIDNITMSNCEYGLDVRYAYNKTITNITASDSDMWQIYIVSSDNVTVDTVHSTNAGDYLNPISDANVVSFDGAVTNSIIRNVWADGSGWSGIDVSGDIGDSSNILVENIHMNNSGHNGIDIHQGYFVTVKDCVVTNSVADNYLFGGNPDADTTQNVSLINCTSSNAGGNGYFISGVDNFSADTFITSGDLTAVKILAGTNGIITNFSTYGDVVLNWDTTYNIPSSDIVIMDSDFHGDTTDLYNAYNIYLANVNSSFTSQTGSHNGTVFWPINVLVTDNQSNTLSGATVTLNVTTFGLNGLGEYFVNTTTDENGYPVSPIYVPDYRRDSATGYTYYNLNTVSAEKDGESATSAAFNPDETWYSIDSSSPNGTLITLPLDVPGEGESETHAENFVNPTFVAVGGGFAAVIFAIGSWINQRRKRF